MPEDRGNPTRFAKKNWCATSEAKSAGGRRAGRGRPGRRTA
jgi:hypothetical protein